MIDMDKEGTERVIQSLITDVQERYKVYTKEMLNKSSHYGGIWYKSLMEGSGTKQQEGSSGTKSLPAWLQTAG